MSERASQSATERASACVRETASEREREREGREDAARQQFNTSLKPPVQATEHRESARGGRGHFISVQQWIFDFFLGPHFAALAGHILHSG